MSGSDSNSYSGLAEEGYRDWLELPKVVLLTILGKSEVEEILKSKQLVCKLWCHVCKEPSLWNSICMQNPGNKKYYQKYNRMTRIAVDRSCGVLNDIRMEFFPEDELMPYIADRSPQLKCFHLERGYIMDYTFIEAVKKLPLLEELEFTCVIYQSFDEIIKELGRSCPLLKTFKLNGLGFRCRDPDVVDDDEALAISESMRGLHHLQLVGNSLTNNGLKAIIDNCVSLESLDLRACAFVDLSSGELEKRIKKQIKEFRYPGDRDVGEFKYSIDFPEDDLFEYSSSSDYGSLYDYEDYAASTYYDDDYVYDSDELHEIFDIYDCI